VARASATTQLLCVAGLVLLIATDAATTWAIPVLALLAAAVLAGERTEDHAAPDRQIETLADDGGAPDLRLAVVLALVLYAGVLSGVGVLVVAETCSALLLPFLVSAGAFGALRLHVAAVLARP
jgi:hypothetical protein